jgi:hypothetical protein
VRVKRLREYEDKPVEAFIEKPTLLRVPARFPLADYRQARS